MFRVQTFASARPADNWEALAHTLAMFRQIAIEVGAHLGYAYPHKLHQRAVEYFEHIKRMAAPD